MARGLVLPYISNTAELRIPPDGSGTVFLNEDGKPSTMNNSEDIFTWLPVDENGYAYLSDTHRLKDSGGELQREVYDGSQWVVVEGGV